MNKYLIPGNRVRVNKRDSFHTGEKGSIIRQENEERHGINIIFSVKLDSGVTRMFFRYKLDYPAIGYNE